MKSILLGSMILALSACASKAPEAPAAPKLPSTLHEALQSPYRTEGSNARDTYRHPVETLEFFGLQPTMTVVEISPGAGWYAEILAPYLNLNGKYIAAAVPVSVYAGGQKFVDWLKANPEIAAKVTVNELNPPATKIAEDGSADMVLTFRNVHNWMKRGTDKDMFEAFFKALKPGGVLGVVEHRANPKTKVDKKAESGYVSEKEVIRLAESAGFKLAAKSEMNANPKDIKKYPKGVWSLPPTYAEGEAHKAKYAEIGESDRMTLKFVKP